MSPEVLLLAKRIVLVSALVYAGVLALGEWYENKIKRIRRGE